jgi:hypothetical protein
VERTVAQGALETTREKYDQMQRQMTSERSTRRHNGAADNADNNVEALPPRSAASKHEGRNGSSQTAKPVNGAAAATATN